MARPLGAAQDIHTTAFDARVTVRPSTDPAPEPGDAPYTVDVTVDVTRGAWEFGPALVRLVSAAGTANGPVDGTPADPVTLRAGAPTTWRLPFEHPAGVGIGEGAHIAIADAAGETLATWLT